MRISIAHLSDLHYSSAHARWYDSRLGRRSHCQISADALGESLDLAAAAIGLQSRQDFKIIISGDLTSGGAGVEFDAVQRFLFHSDSTSQGDPSRVGLGLDPSNVCYIAGNHDHWNGENWLTSPARQTWIYDDGHFKAQPWKTAWQSAEGNLVVEIFGIDSSGGFGLADGNWFARGLLHDSDLRSLESLLATRPSRRDGNVVRVLACHHSLTSALYIEPVAYVQQLPVYPNRLDEGSIEELLSLCAEHNVTALLTGHVHHFAGPEPLLRRTRWMSDMYSLCVHEARCASTLHRECRARGFWIHDFQADRGVTTWTAYRYRYEDKKRRFTRREDFAPINCKAMPQAAGA